MIRLRHYLPRWQTVAIGIFFGWAYATAGTMDFNDKVGAAEDRYELNHGRIWSKKCEREHMDTAATKADQKPWKIHCIPKRTLST